MEIEIQTPKVIRRVTISIDKNSDFQSFMMS